MEATDEDFFLLRSDGWWRWEGRKKHWSRGCRLKKILEVTYHSHGILKTWNFRDPRGH